MAFLRVQECVKICPQIRRSSSCSVACSHSFGRALAVACIYSSTRMLMMPAISCAYPWQLFRKALQTETGHSTQMYALRGLQQYRNMMVHSWSSFYVAISLHPRQLKPKGNPIEKFCLKKAIDKPLEYHQTSRNIEVFITLSHSTGQPVFWPAPVRSWFKRRVFAGGHNDALQIRFINVKDSARSRSCLTLAS